jgi:hypothetical protein
VAWQIVARFVPIASIWAFYRIKKLQRYLLYVFVPSFFATAWVVGFALAPLLALTTASVVYYQVALGYFLFNSPAYLAVYLIVFGLHTFSIYLIIIWSRQHNRTFDMPTASPEPPQ